MIGLTGQYGDMQIIGQDIPPINSTFLLKSGVRARLIDRSGSMVMVEVREASLRVDRVERGQSQNRGE